MNNGLDGVIAAETALSMVDGAKGELVIAGYPVEELAPNATFEETVEILWGSCGAGFSLRPSERRLKPAPHHHHSDPMEALRVALPSSTGDDGEDARNLLAAFPVIVAAW